MSTQTVRAAAVVAALGAVAGCGTGQTGIGHVAQQCGDSVASYRYAGNNYDVPLRPFYGHVRLDVRPGRRLGRITYAPDCNGLVSRSNGRAYAINEVDPHDAIYIVAPVETPGHVYLRRGLKTLPAALRLR